MELAAALGTAKSGGLIMAVIAHAFTISYVANLLDEDEDWLPRLSAGVLVIGQPRLPKLYDTVVQRGPTASFWEYFGKQRTYQV